MTSRRPIAIAGVATAVALAPAAAAQAQQPTLQFDRPCYTAEQPLAFTGTGYTPNGPVELLFSAVGQPRAGFDVTADVGGGISGRPGVEEDALLADDEDRREIFVTANDRTRIDAGAPPESQFGAAQLTFTRWAGFSPGRYVPGRKVQVEAYGWAFAAGKPLFFLFQKGRRTVASVRAGRLSATCGDLVARVRVPKKLKAGSYRLVLATERKSPSGLYTWRKGRVTERARASAAAAAPMRRAG